MAVLSGGQAVTAMDAGAKATVEFDGTGVRWLGYRDEWSGIATVFVDGKRAGRVDTYASSAAGQQTLFAVEGLAPGRHTLEIEVQMRKHKKSSGFWIWIDAIEIVQ
jgi:hypothetical protein